MKATTAIVLATSTMLSLACSSNKQPSEQAPAPATRPPSIDAVAATAPPDAAAAPISSTTTVLGFDADPAGQPPKGMTLARTNGGALGTWLVRAEADAPSPPNVLAQLDPDDTDMRFPIAVTDVQLRDVRVSVRCKLISGKVDQAAGLVVRYRDANNYYITRTNALENNVRLYTVKDGKRRQIASWSGPVKANVWHDYAIEIRGDHIQVFWNGKRVLDHHDSTFTEPGRVGVWTKADSITYFDDLKTEAL
ncbi:MAG: DUF1080 domain-containing protein [Deltaproteobacteria bacterium]|nr:DUF1080 domain-containing protein [Deltaproteobacteria bacterium]